MVDAKASEATRQFTTTTVAFLDPALGDGERGFGAVLVMTVSTAATAVVEIVFEHFLFFVREFLHEVLMFGSIDRIGFHVVHKPR